jgi:hypothetical protein
MANPLAPENGGVDVAIHVDPETVVIGEFRVEDGRLRASLQVELIGRAAGQDYSRRENLTVLVEPLGAGIAVSVRDSILDLASLAEVARIAAGRLSSETGVRLLAETAAAPMPPAATLAGPTVVVALPARGGADAWHDG